MSSSKIFQNLQSESGRLSCGLSGRVRADVAPSKYVPNLVSQAGITIVTILILSAAFEDLLVPQAFIAQSDLLTYHL